MNVRIRLYEHSLMLIRLNGQNVLRINLNEHIFIVRININEQVVSKRTEGQFCQNKLE